MSEANMADYKWFVLLPVCYLLCDTAFANTLGTQFVFSLAQHMPRGGGDDLFLLVTSRFVQTNVQGESPTSALNFNKTISKGVTEIKLSYGAAESPVDFSNTGFYISSDNPISVQVMDFVTKNADGLNLLPLTSRDKEFYAMSYAPDVGLGKSQIVVTAFFARTLITVNVKTKSGSFRWRGGVYKNGSILRMYIGRLQRIQLQHDDDLTGSHITASKPVGVVTGTSCSFVPIDIPYCDCMYDQIPPVSSWGKSFIINGFRGRSYNRFRVLAARANTNVTIGYLGSQILGAGGFIEERVSNDSIMHIEADKPILVVQMSESARADYKPGDPFMAVIPSVDHFSDGFVFATPGHFAFHHLSITIETDLASGLRLNGKAVSRDDENTTYVLENGNNKEYSVIRFDLKHGTYNLTHTDVGVKFGALLYGFGDYVSYGYSLGYRISAIEGARLVGGNASLIGRLEVNVGGTWSGLCADGIGVREAKVICRSLGFGQLPLTGSAVKTVPPANVPNVTEILPTIGCNGTESSLDSCAVSLGYQHNCSVDDDVFIDCVPHLTGIVRVGCTSSSWIVDVDMHALTLRNPGSVATDIHLGDNSCRGTETGHRLYFKNDIHSCFTSQTKKNGHLTYTNQLVYGYQDKAHPYIIRDFNWTLNIQCDVYPNGSALSHSSESTVSPTPIPTGASHQNTSNKYNLVLKLFTDPNYVHAIPEDPIKVALGTEIYVKAYVTNVDWDVVMRLYSCYTTDTQAANAKKYYLIKDGCEVDTNTQLTSKSEHETKFQFQMFEMTTNHGSVYLHCDAVYCDSTKPSTLTQCAHHCNLNG